MSKWDYMFTLFLTIILSCAGDTTEPSNNQLHTENLPDCIEVDLSFVNMVSDILEKPKDQWNDYPTPPAPICDIYYGLNVELEDTTTLQWFQKLDSEHSRLTENDMVKTIVNYFESNDLIFYLCACVVHFNPDARITATESLARSNNHKKTISKFLLYVLEETPHVISGNENSTIHGIWIQSMFNALNDESFEVTNDYGSRYSDAVQFWKEVLED